LSPPNRRIAEIRGLENPEIWFFAQIARKTTSGSGFHFIFDFSVPNLIEKDIKIAAILENRRLAISRPYFDQIWHGDTVRLSCAFRWLKFHKFKNFNQIWHNDAVRQSSAFPPFKFHKFKYPRKMVVAAILEPGIERVQAWTR